MLLLAHLEVTVTQEDAWLCLFSRFSRVDYKNNLLMFFHSQRNKNRNCWNDSLNKCESNILSCYNFIFKGSAIQKKILSLILLNILFFQYLISVKSYFSD